MGRDESTKDAAGLRKRAEAALKEGAARRAERRGEDPERVLHELEVHQVELEMQNQELRQAQAELTNLYDRYHDLYDHAPVGYLTLDRVGTVKDANLTLADLLGVARADLLGRPLSGFMREPSADALRVCLNDAIASGIERGVEVVIETRGERGEVPAHIDMIALRDAHGERSECRAAVVDLSKLRLAERGLRSAEAQSATVLDTVADAIVCSDAGGTIESFNRAAERLFGYSEAEVLGKNVRLLMPSPYREEHDRYMERYLLTGESRIIGKPNREVTGLKKSGTTFPLELGIGEWFDGAERKFVAVLHDLTEREQAEAERVRLLAQFHQAQKLEALGTLASGVAHDFSNLLMGIGGCTNIALSTLSTESPARMYLEEIKKSAENGAAVSKRLLDFTRKKNNTQFQVVGLDPLIDSVRNLLARMLTEDIELVVRLEAEGGRVRADPGLLEQVLVNLAANARDAMPGGGSLTFETKNVALVEDNAHSLPRGAYVLLTVSDTGIGMDEPTAERVFEPFFTTKGVGKGTGLGLSMVHGIIEQVGGKIEVKSAPGQGTLFDIFLPTTSEPVTHDSDVPPDDVPGLEGTGTVLLVEDDPAVRMGTRFYLEQGGYRVLEASSGQEAIECCRNYSKSIDLLLSDVVLPGMGGLEISREVRAIKPGTPVLYMSAHPAEWLEGQGRIEPGAPVVEKPIGPEKLLLNLQRILGAQARPNAGKQPARTIEKPSRGQVLVVEDQGAARLAITAHLRDAGWEVCTTENAGQALRVAQPSQHDFVALVIDYGLPDIKGDALARELKSRYPKAALVYMSGYPDLKLDPTGLLLTKPLDLEVISATLERLVEG